MIQNTIRQIEERLQSAENLSPEKRRELAALLESLKQEVNALSHTHAEQAQSIAGFTQVSTHEATRAEVNPDLLQYSLDGLKTSVQGFEESHPKLVHTVNSICTTLSNLGI
jgi:hypothetical protein